MGVWRRALVTGASAGIGEAFARRLAAEGTALVLVARRGERLATLAGELRAQGASVEVLAADLCDAEGLEAVAGRLGAHEEPVDLLVNNAGAARFGPFWELPVEGEHAQVALNITAVLHLTHAALARMVPTGRGTVLNLSSVSGNQPGPGSATYSAAKGFVTTFTEALAVELRGTGVTATVVCPGLTRTEFYAAAQMEAPLRSTPGWLWMSPAAVAADALAAAEARKVVHVTGFGNKVLSVLANSAPRGLRRRVAGAVLARYGRGA